MDLVRCFNVENQYLAATVKIPFCEQAWNKARSLWRIKGVEPLIDGTFFFLLT